MMPWRGDPGPPFPVRSRRPQARAGLTGVLIVIAVLTIGWLWYAVFNPLFDSPTDWAARDRAFRSVVQEILSGRTDHLGVQPDLPRWPPPSTRTQRELVACAEAQVARGVRLSVRYHPMGYPWADVPEHLATSADLVIRCLRKIGLDLQQLIHHDRRRFGSRYPLHLWTSRRPDTAIDHRRLPNLHAFVSAYFEPYSALTDSPAKRAAFLPGDLVFWTPGGGEFPGLAGLVLDRRTEEGVPIVATLVSEDSWMSDHHPLTDWPVTGHFRALPDRIFEKFLGANPDADLVPAPTP